jgi:hypothetical protein
MPNGTSPESTGSSGSTPPTPSVITSVTAQELRQRPVMPREMPLITLDEFAEVTEEHWKHLLDLIAKGPKIPFRVTWIMANLHDLDVDEDQVVLFRSEDRVP